MSRSRIGNKYADFVMDGNTYSDGGRFRAAIAAIDAANAADPRHETGAGGAPAGELIYGQRMSAMMLATFASHASEPLQLAVRAQHLERWVVPRSAFPETRAGYHRWRTILKEHHATRAGEILSACGYGPALIERVQALIRKEGLGQDHEAQTLEDVACLVFLAYYLAPFAARHTEEKLSGIIRRTWRKMSEAGRAAALELPLGTSERALVERALAGFVAD